MAGNNYIFLACCFPCLAFSKNNLPLRHVNMQGDIHPASGNIVRCNVSWWLTPVMTLNTLGSQLHSAVPSASLPLYFSSPRFVHLALCHDIHHHCNIEGMTPLTCMFYYVFFYTPVFFWCFWVGFVAPDLARSRKNHTKSSSRCKTPLLNHSQPCSATVIQSLVRLFRIFRPFRLSRFFQVSFCIAHSWPSSARP